MGWNILDQISHEVQRGAQRASCVVLGTSGLRACSEMGTLEGFEHKNDENRWEGSKEKAGSPCRVLLRESR